MGNTHWTLEWRKEYNQLKDYCNDLEAKNKFLRESLVDISVGVTFTVDATYDKFTALQMRAGKALAKEATMQNRIERGYYR